MTVHQHGPTAASSGSSSVVALSGQVGTISTDVTNGEEVCQLQQQQQQQPTKTARPKPVILWSVVDVQKWLRRHCGEYYHLYSEYFLEQDVTGRSLIRLNENSLMRLGIVHRDHRQAILRLISKLRLRDNYILLRHGCDNDDAEGRNCVEA